MKPDRFPLKIYYADTDAGGVVYHARFLEFFERARWEAFSARDLSITDLSAKDIHFAVAGADIQFRKPVRLGEAVVVETYKPDFGRASLTVPQNLVRASDGTVLAEGKIRIVCINSNWKPVPVPDIVRKALSKGA